MTMNTLHRRLRALRGPATRPEDERIVIIDPAGETVMSLGVGAALALASSTLDVVAEIAEAYPTIEAVISEPTVTAADLATVFELGRQSGLRTTVTA